MKIAIVLPRNMHFGPHAASSIDLCVRDAVLFSRFKGSTTVICQEVDELFHGVDVRTYRPGPTRQRVAEIAGIARQLRPDLMVVHQHLPSASALARRLRPVPVLLHKHNFIDPVTWFRRQRRSRQLNRLAGIVFVSQACRDAFVAAFPAVRPPSFVAPNGLDPTDWPPHPEKRREIVAVGRVEANKGSVEIAEALARVLPGYPGWHARLVGPITGDGAYIERARAAIGTSPRIAMTDALPFRDVVALTRQAEIAIVNSRKEAFGRVAIEAFAGETALISSVVGGLAEVVGDAGLPLKDGTADEIAGALERLLSDAVLRRRLAAAGRDRFDAGFRMERTAAVLDSVYARYAPEGAATAQTAGA